jgi:hypothetical protein
MMLAQTIMSAIARAFASTAERRDDHRRRGSAARTFVVPGEVVQLDAIGYSEEELIAQEIKTHREAIALYEDEARGSDARLSVFARQILPQLQQHLAVLETLKSDFVRSHRS